MIQTFTYGSLFLEGLLSFFSPCVLPLIPLYIGYITSDIDPESSRGKSRVQTAVVTFFFILGICTVFFIAGLGAGALNSLYNAYKIQFTLFSGVLLIFLGLFSLGVIQIPFLQQERKIHFAKRGGILNAYLLGFFFSFAWSPCIGPLLASAILAAAQASSKLIGFTYIGAYALGFIVMFILIGLFTDEVLARLKKHRNIVKYAEKLGGIMVLGMGIYNLYQGNVSLNSLTSVSTAAVADTTENETAAVEETTSQTDLERYGFTLPDKDGNMINVVDYQGKTIVLNFFGTWCYYCNLELPDLQEINDTRDDVVIVLIAAPGLNGEGDVEYVENYMEEAGYDMLILYDMDYTVTNKYGITGYPTSYFVQPDGTFYGYMPGYMTMDGLTEVLDTLSAMES